jgi:hypothetical protein
VASGEEEYRTRPSSGEVASGVAVVGPVLRVLPLRHVGEGADLGDLRRLVRLAGRCLLLVHLLFLLFTCPQAVAEGVVGTGDLHGQSQSMCSL